MDFINNFLTSGYSFSKEENLQKFRFSLLNSSMLIASVFTFINYFGSVFKFVPFPPVYEHIVLFYAISCLVSIIILRVKKSYFLLATNIVVLTSLVVFYAALLMVKADEFRLIWFFLVVFASFVLLGKRYGITLMFIVLISILIINQMYELGFSKLAQFSFFNSFLIFAAFSYFFLEKIEKDSLEFSSLNGQLKNKILQEKQQRKEQEQMLLRQCRMANMGEMLDSIAHQWRQPLMHINSILLNMDSDLETRSAADQKNLNKRVDEISSLTEHMSQTIEDFRTLFKVEQEQTEFSLNKIINDVLVLMKNQLQDIDITFLETKETQLFSNKSELMQVIIIILANAVEALEINKIKQKRITIQLQEEQNTISILIEDNAGGISQKNIKKIFDPYFTSKTQSGGTGLGLYIANIIIKHKMLGNIIATNTLEGAKFEISLRKNHVKNT